MAHPLIFPGRYFFYLIGNTPAVCLSRDFAPEEQLKILLLGCGDPRNVLFTVYNELPNIARKLDFTCCDYDPAILARNVILYTMVVDKVAQRTVWNVFFHMFISKDDEAILINHCTKLFDLSATMEAWKASPYGDLIQMCTDHTRQELRKYWTLYLNMPSLPQDRKDAIAESFQKMKRFVQEKDALFTFPLRSCGPLGWAPQPLEVIPSLFKSYWESGTTFSSPAQISRATSINPTFAYCKAGEGCYVHYATDPVTPFHLASVFSNATDNIKEKDVVASAVLQFKDWCLAFHSLVSSPGRVVIRLLVGDLFATCMALDWVYQTGNIVTNIPIAPWTDTKFDFTKDYSNNGSAPTRFDVIDTSNLQDHFGLLNVLVASVSVRARGGVIYSETLRTAGPPEDPTRDLNARLYNDVETLGLLLGIYPLEYLSGFTSLSNTHEFAMCFTEQFRQLITWKSPDSGDPNIMMPTAPTVNPVRLARFLWNLYGRLFANEDFVGLLQSFRELNATSATRSMNDPHYTRESFIFFLKMIRRQLQMSLDQWLRTMSHFVDLQEEEDAALPMRTLHCQELYALLHYHGLYTVRVYLIPMPKIGRFADWPELPPLVRVWLSVPREKLLVLGSPSAMNAKSTLATTFELRCFLKGSQVASMFSAVRVAFGTLSGMVGAHLIQFKEDSQGWYGNTPLVASFLVPTHMLSLHEPQGSLTIALCLWPTPAASASFMSKLGAELCVFRARFLDERHVKVAPVDVLPPSIDQLTHSSPPVDSRQSVSAIGDAGPPTAEFDAGDQQLSSLVCKINIPAGSVREQFRSQVTEPQIRQLSSCVMRLSLGSNHQEIPFPFPVSGAKNKLRLARKSGYIEVVVPLSKPLSHENFDLNPFPVIGQTPSLTPWNIHRVNLDRLAPVNTALPSLDSWFHPHIGSMMSQREKTIRDSGGKDVLLFVKDSIHSILVRFTGIQGAGMGQAFLLQDKASGTGDAMIFLQSLLFDAQSHTVVCEGYILPLSRPIYTLSEPPSPRLMQNMIIVLLYEGELRAWKHLIPALVERCRRWHHGPNCEYKALGKIPLSEELETNPLCSCGQGQDVEEMTKNPLWRPFAKYAYRIALSLLFGVSLLETVVPPLNEIAHHLDITCLQCGGKGQPKLMSCSRCKMARYCSKKCQQEDWKKHKTLCQAI